MRPITLDEIKNLHEYEKSRKEYRQQVIEHKRPRRIPVGDIVTLVFENRTTLLFQIHEMVRAERIVDEAKLQEELDVYNPLLPGDGELSATMFIEIPDEAELRRRMPQLPHVERAVSLDLGDGVRVQAEAEGERSRDDRTASVHYLKFPMTADAWDRLANAPEVSLRIDHRNYEHNTVLSDEARRSLLADRRD